MIDNYQNIEIKKDMKYALSFWFHVVFWLVMQLYYFYSMDLFGVPFDRALNSKLFFLPFQFIAAYFMLFVLLGRFLYKGKYIKSILSFIVFIFVLPYIAYFVNEYLLKYAADSEYAPPDIISILLNIEDLITEYMRVIFLTPLILICLEFGVSQFQKMKEVEDLIASKKVAELNLLKTQIHPDFLLSTLRNLERLTEVGDEDGPVVIERLSEALDYILYKGRKEKITIEKELEAISHYIALENIRFKKTTSIIQSVENVDLANLLSPLILFSFLEINFKGYDQSNIPFSKCEIIINQIENKLLCTIMNTKKKDIRTIPILYEEQDMRRQLDISYPEKYDIFSDDTNEYYQITLEINL